MAANGGTVPCTELASTPDVVEGAATPCIGLRTTLVPDQLGRMIDITGRPLRDEPVAGKHKDDERMRGQR